MLPPCLCVDLLVSGQVELYKDIADSRRELDDEQSYIRRSYGREREQMSSLQTLGLSEVEAVEYVLMLSRDEEEARRRVTPPREDEGVFIGDFDDIQTPAAVEVPLSRANLTSMSTSRSPRDRNGSPKSQPLAAPPNSNVKVQVSPRFQPEPMEAGMSISPISHEGSLTGSLSSSMRNDIPVPNSNHFPSMSPTPTSRSGAGTPIRRSVSGSPESVRSAWSTPLRFSKSGGPSPPTSSNPSAASSYRHPIVAGPSSPSGRRGSRGGFVSGLTMSMVSNKGEASKGGSTSPPSPGRSSRQEAEDREAEELRYAIELSLAEARSRSQDV